MLLQAAVAYLLNPPAVEALGGPHYGLTGRVGTKRARKLAKKYKKSQIAQIELDNAYQILVG